MKKLHDQRVIGGALDQKQAPNSTLKSGAGKLAEGPSGMESKPQSALPVDKHCKQLHTYIMCGGGGTRLWPLSRADNPKQNLKLISENSMLEDTVGRVNDINVPDVVTTIVNLMGNRSQCATMQEMRARHDAENGIVIAEPFGKNTAPAVAIASLHSSATADADPYVLVLPSDHVIEPASKFSDAIAASFKPADEGQIVVFGIEPTAPVTGYGYIEVEGFDAVSPVNSFREKPDLKTAKRYIKTGKHLWNAGILLFRASTMLAALENHAHCILEGSRKTLEASKMQDQQIDLNPDHFQAVPADSIDFAVMEHATNVTVVRADFDWHDVGSFASLKNIQYRDARNNVIRGDILAEDCTNSLLHSDGHLIAAIGLENVSVVATPDATLIAPIDRCEDIKQIVSRLEASNRRETKQSPWLREAGAIPGAMKNVWQNWLFDDALPFWLEDGMDEEHGGFHEILNFNGQSTVADKRLRTMARQIFVFGKSIEMGWQGKAQKAIQHGLAFLDDSPDSPTGGWYKTFDAKSKPLDLTEDAYDHAFVLLALAQTKKAGVEANPILLNRVLATLDKLRISNADGAFLGYAENSSNTLPRRSNPHMHLLEAFMAFYEATDDEKFLMRAGEIVKLFESHFFDADNLLLGESFDQHLNFIDGAVLSVEPGHHFEWVHLLHKYAQLSQIKPLNKIAGLFSVAYAQGINPVSNFAYDEIDAQGAPSHQTSRCWVQTELLACLSVLTNSGKNHMRFKAERHAQNLWDKYIVPAPKGMWMDVVDGRGDPVSKSVPASTFYHLINGIDNYANNIG